MTNASSENKKEIPIDRNSPVDGDFFVFQTSVFIEPDALPGGNQVA